MVNEIFSKDGMVWWVGVVENRNDPLKLGRCQVRIFGYHTEDVAILPTSELPWSIPMQPITSAAISGKGSTPLGPVEGTWVVGWFLDGLEKQQPLMIGTLGGISRPNPYCNTTERIPTTSQINYLRDSSGNLVYDSSGNPIQTAPSETPGQTVSSDLPPLTKDKIRSVMDAIGFKESSSVPGGTQNYGAQNSLGYIGKYQFGAAALIDLGYVKSGTTNFNLNDSSNWTGKNGMSSKEAFLKAGETQEQIMFDYMKVNYNRLLKSNKITTSDSPEHIAGLLASSHLVGSGNSDKFDKKDGNGVKASTYYSLGNKAAGGGGLIPSESADNTNRQCWVPGHPNNPNNEPSGPLNSPVITQSRGFEDPNKVYPTCEYSGLPDTNKLAVGDRSHASLKNKANRKISKIPVASTQTTWDEPDSPFCGKYPYNHVIETEAGHVVEMDNTPGKERIQVYHKSGSYIEIDVNGTMVKKTVGDSYEISERNGYAYVRGAYNLTVDGATKIFVRDNADIQVEGETTIIGHNNVTVASAEVLSAVAKRAIVTGSDSVSLITDGDLNLQAKTINMRATSAINLDSKRNLSLNGKIAVAIDGGIIRNRMGHTVVNQLGSVVPPPAKRSPDLTQLPALKVPVCDPRTFNLDENEPEAAAYRRERLNNGEITNEVPKENGEASVQPNIVPLEPCDCSEFTGITDFPDTLRLSKHFTLGALTNRAPASNYPLQPARGKTKAQLACNLKNIAVNVLDTIRDKYPDMIVTSGLRNSTGDHGLGLAVDMQFVRTGFSKYYDIVQWISQNVPYKQLLLEYENRPSGRIAWIHIAYDSAGGKSGMPTGTLLNHATYKSNYFVNLA